MQKSRITTILTPLRLALVSMLLLSTASCKTLRTEVVERTAHDTLYQAQERYDSICILENNWERYHPSPVRYDSVLQTLVKVDTICRESVKTEFRYKLLHDTTYIHKVDTIPKVVVQHPPEKQRRNTPFLMKLFSLIGLCTVIWCIFKLRT